MTKPELEALLGAYEWWMSASTIALAVGILGEYILHFIPGEKLSRARVLLGILLAVLVVGGVAGEYITGDGLAQTTRTLRGIADKEVEQANAQAADADQKAEEERLARRKIEAELSPRALDAEARAALIAHLRDSSGQVQVIAVPNPEARSLAQGFLSALQEAGWSPGGQVINGLDEMVVGIAVVVDSGNAPPERADHLVDALSKAGFPAQRMNRGGEPSDQVELIVGYKGQ